MRRVTGSIVTLPASILQRRCQSAESTTADCAMSAFLPGPALPTDPDQPQSHASPAPVMMHPAAAQGTGLAARPGLLPDVSRTLAKQPDSGPYRQVGQLSATVGAARLK